MNMAAAILKCKPLSKLDKEIEENETYIKADKEFHKIINKELSREKAQELDELLGILIAVVGRAYLVEGRKLGVILFSSLLFE